MMSQTEREKSSEKFRERTPAGESENRGLFLKTMITTVALEFVV